MRIVSLLLLSITVVGGATTPADAVIQVRPRSNGHFCSDPPTAAVCSDGATWLVWAQYPASRYWAFKTPKERANASEVGLFCRLVAADGSDVVPPVQILKPTLNRHFPNVLSPSYFAPLARSDGGLLVLANDPDPLTNGRDPSPWPTTTSVVAVDRSGAVDRMQLEGAICWNRGMPNHELTAAFWSWFDSAGSAHCLYRQDNKCVRRAILGVAGNRLDLRPGSALYYSAWNSRDSAEFQRTNAGHIVSRRDLRWTEDEWVYAAIAPAGRDTLLMVYIPPNRKKYPWLTHPSDTIVIHRMRASDLSLIDSLRVNAELVSGADYPAAMLPCAILQRTKTGFTFVISRPTGPTAYELDASGNPVLGSRAAAPLAAQSDSSSTVHFANRL